MSLIILHFSDTYAASEHFACVTDVLIVTLTQAYYYGEHFHLPVHVTTACLYYTFLRYSGYGA